MTIAHAPAHAPGKARVTPMLRDLPPCLLSYAFSTAPSPLQASTASAASAGLIEVWASAGQGTVYCNQITLAVPIGTGPNDLTNVTPSVTPNTTWWVVSSSDVRPGSELGLDPAVTYAIFNLDCVSAQNYEIDYELIFAMAVSAVSLVPNTFQFAVVENSGSTSDPTQFQQRSSLFTLEKGPAQLYLDDFIATSASSASGTEPMGEFASGEPIRLTWASNAASFALYAAGQATPLWTGANTSYTVANGLTADTTFTLVAAAGSGTPAPTIAATLCLTVSNPIVAASSVSAGTLSVAGPTSVGGGTGFGNAGVGGTLTAAGAAQLNGGATAASLTVAGASTLTGAATLGAATVGGTLTASGSAVLGSATVSILSLLGSAASFTMVAVGPGQYTATTDGLVVGVVNAPSDASSACLTWIFGQTSGGIGIAATGGNVTSWTDGGKHYYTLNRPCAFLLPVAQGQVCGLGVQQDQHNSVNATAAFYWVPFAKNGTLQSQSAEVAAKFGLGARRPPLTPSSTRVPRPRVGRQVTAVVDAAAAIFGPGATAALRHQLADALLRLASAAPRP